MQDVVDLLFAEENEAARRRQEGSRPRVPAQCRSNKERRGNVIGVAKGGCLCWEALARRIVSRQLEDNRRLVGSGDLFLLLFWEFI